MSFKTTIDCLMPVEIEIDRDGKLTMHGYEEEYDLAYTAMSGGEQSLCQKILQNWNDWMYAVICFDLGLSDDVLNLLSLDLVDYAVRSGVLGWAYPDSPHTEDLVAAHAAMVEQLIILCRGYVESAGPFGKGAYNIIDLIGQLRATESELGRVMGIYGLGTRAGDEVFECFGEALDRASRNIINPGRPGLALVARSISQATHPRYIGGMSHRPDHVRKIDQKLQKWFIARFVDVMEVWQPGQRWPAIEETP